MSSNGNNGVTNFLTKEAIPFVANVFLHEGSIMRLLENFIIEPTIFVSNDLKHDQDLLNRAISDQIDVFCSFYSMAFQVMNGLAGSKAAVYLRALGTNQYDYSYNFGEVTKRGLRKALDGSFTSFTTESYNGNEFPLMTFKNSTFLSSSFEDGTRTFQDSRTITNNQLDSKKLEGNGYGVHVRFFELTTRRKFQQTLPTQYKLGNKLMSPGDVDNYIQDWCHEQNYQFNSKENAYTHIDDTKPPLTREGLLRQLGIETISGSDKIEEKDLVIPIVVRAHVLFFSKDDLETVLDVKSDENSFTRRYWKWRSGGISFKDLIFAGDLIKEYREHKKIKNTQILDVINGKGYNATMTAMFNQGKFGYEKFFNLYLLSAEDRDYIERRTKRQFADPSFVQNLVTNLQAMELMVLDTNLDVGQMYLHAMPQPSTFRLQNLGKRKDKPTDLGEMLKSLYANRAPVF